VQSERPADGRRITSQEMGELRAVAAAIALSLAAVCGLSVLAARVPALRQRLQSSRWRMRLAMMAFMASYNLLTRRQRRRGAGAGEASP